SLFERFLNNCLLQCRSIYPNPLFAINKEQVLFQLALLLVLFLVFLSLRVSFVIYLLPIFHFLVDYLLLFYLYYFLLRLRLHLFFLYLIHVIFRCSLLPLVATFPLDHVLLDYRPSISIDKQFLLIK